jgi:hypothetical protein
MEQIQYAFVAVLVAASVSFAVMGLGKVLRRRRLARDAHQRGLRFFPDDPYDVPRRYADFAVISSGHSPCANNVTAGGIAGRTVRAFDFCCELGHGTRRLTRRYSVAVAETHLSQPSLLMWHAGDGELAPLAARDVQGQVGQWGFCGSRELAETVQAACRHLGHAQPSVEIRGSVVLIAVPVRRSIRQYALALDEVSGIIEALDGPRGPKLPAAAA